MPPITTIGLLTDVHYGPSIIGDRVCPEGLARWTRALARLRDLGVETVVHLGDLVDDGSSAEADLARCAAMRTAAEASGLAVRYVVGNHDVAALTKAEFLTAVGASPSPYYTFEAGLVLGIVLDGNCHADGSDFAHGRFSWDDAWISPAQLDWLADTLRAAAGRPTLVCCHPCLDDAVWNGAPDPHVVRNAPAVRRLLREAGVRAVLQGHYHPGRETVVDGIPYLALPALAIDEAHVSVVRVSESGVEVVTV